MFARRASWDLSPNELAERAAVRRAAGLPLVDLGESNPTRCEIPEIAALLQEALLELAADPRAARYEPSARGDAAARAAIAGHHAAQGAPIEAERIVLTAGTSEGYAHLFRLLGDPGDRVLVPRPSYPLFDFLAGLEGLEAVPYDLRLEGGAWRVDPLALGRAASERARAVVVVHPNNPTGSFVRTEDVRMLRAFCAVRGLALISDEVFADAADPAIAPAWPPSLLVGGDADDAPLGFVLQGLSKALGLPQLKLAWIVASGPRRLRDEALARLEVIADTYLSVGALPQLAAPGLLRRGAAVRRAIASRVAANRARLDAALTAVPGASRLPSDGGWYAIVRTAGAAGAAPDEDALALALLEEDGVLVQPGWLFDLEAEAAAHVVVSLLLPEAAFGAAVARLAARLSRV